MKYIRHYWTRIIRRLATRGNKSISKEERYAQIIVRKLLADSSTDLLLSPSDHKLYIKTDSGSIFVVITIENRCSDIQIINHRYCYRVVLGSRAAENIEVWFLNEVERRRREMEHEFTSNIEHSLYNIVTSIN